MAMSSEMLYFARRPWSNSLPAEAVGEGAAAAATMAPAVLFGAAAMAFTTGMSGVAEAGSAVGVAASLLRASSALASSRLQAPRSYSTSLPIR